MNALGVIREDVELDFSLRGVEMGYLHTLTALGIKELASDGSRGGKIMTERISGRSVTGFGFLSSHV